MPSALQRTLSHESDTFFNHADGSLKTIAHAYLRHAPFSLCLREMNRLLALSWLEKHSGRPLQAPILDVGCGDGFLWSLSRWKQDQTLRERVHGVDISSTEIKKAKHHIQARLVDVSAEFDAEGMRYAELIGNCSMEHIPEIHRALSNLRKCAHPEQGRLILFVPTPNWALQGHTQGFLLRKFPRLAMMIAGAMNGFFQHWHLYSASVWTALLASTGWKVTLVKGLGNERSEFWFRLGLPTAFPGFLVKKILNVYPNEWLSIFPKSWAHPFSKLLIRALQVPVVDADHPKAYEYMLVAEPLPSSE